MCLLQVSGRSSLTACMVNAFSTTSDAWSLPKLGTTVLGVCKLPSSVYISRVKLTIFRFSPVSTYGGQGVAKRGIDPRSHAVMYMADTGPLVGSDEPRMTKKPLRIVPASPGEKLDPMSRLNFGKVHTVEHNIRVRPIGRVSRAHMPDFVSYAQQELLAS